MTTLRPTTVPVAWQVRSGFVPGIIYRDRAAERFPRKAKPTPEAALRYAERILHFRKIRTNEARRHLAALSDPFWLEVVAGMNLRSKLVHTPVNRDRTGFDGWGVR